MAIMSSQCGSQSAFWFVALKYCRISYGTSIYNLLMVPLATDLSLNNRCVDGYEMKHIEAVDKPLESLKCINERQSGQ